ncbi:E3 ubiquitin-protein ligase HEL2 [Sporobolomyces koalae]|uniref:E3 ubiquitin-protein ligase HEL2 n=1 Tax=Sporobolomyces koalae TaxID=500713 RepID=UPI003176E687
MSRRAAFSGQLTDTSDRTETTPAAVPVRAPAPPARDPAPALATETSETASGPARTARNSRGRGKQRAAATKPSSRVHSSISGQAAAANLAALAKAAADNAVDDGDEPAEQICFICAEPVQYWALGSCNHRTCHTCSIRLRALYKKKECTFCKTECESVIFTESESKPFEEYDAESTPFSDTKLGILFESRPQLEDTLSLLRFNCPSRANPAEPIAATTSETSGTNPVERSSEPCLQILTGWSDLKRHVRAAHHATLCDLCCSNKKIFAHEHELFSLPAAAVPGRHGHNAKRESELDLHLEKQHALCGFCKRWFYDSDGLYKHCREMHEECFICVRGGVRHQYHLNYDRLEQHFKDTHYLCPHPECLAQKFVVFESEIDLQAHALSEHGVGTYGSGGSDQKSRKEARRIETNFVYSTGATERGSNNARGARSGRNANAIASFVEPQPRQALGDRPVPGLGSGPARGRGGFERNLSSANGNSQGGSGSRTPIETTGNNGDRDPETLAQHADLMKRVHEAVGGNEGRIAAFRFAVRSYRSNEMSATDLVDQLFNIFEQRVEESGTLIRGVADLFENAEKRRDVLNAWRDTQNEQNQFPSLAPLAPTLNGVTTAPNSNPARALSAQHRTQRPSTTWDRVERAATSAGPAPIQPRSNPFPALMSASNARNVVGLRNAGVQKKRVVGGSTAWSASGSSGAAAPPVSSFPSLTSASAPVTRQPSPSSFPSLGPSRPAASSSSSSSVRQAPPRASSGLEFPSLPSSSAASDARARMRAALQKPGMSRTITDEGITPPGEREAWAFSGPGVNGSESAQNKKKGKGRQKVVLLSGGLASGRSAQDVQAVPVSTQIAPTQVLPVAALDESVDNAEVTTSRSAARHNSRHDPVQALRGSPNPFFMSSSFSASPALPWLPITPSETSPQAFAGQLADRARPGSSTSEQTRLRSHTIASAVTPSTTNDAQTCRAEAPESNVLRSQLEQMQTDVIQLRQLAIELDGRMQHLVQDIAEIHTTLQQLGNAASERDRQVERLARILDAALLRHGQQEQLYDREGHSSAPQDDALVAELTPPGTVHPSSPVSPHTGSFSHYRTTSSPGALSSVQVGPQAGLARISRSIESLRPTQVEPLLTTHPRLYGPPQLRHLGGGEQVLHAALFPNPSSFDSNGQFDQRPSSDVVSSQASRTTAIGNALERDASGIRAGGSFDWQRPYSHLNREDSTWSLPARSNAIDNEAGATPSNPRSWPRRSESYNYRALLDADEDIEEDLFVRRVLLQNDQQCSLFLQQRVKSSTAERRLRLVEAVARHLLPMSLSKFGNFLVSRCLEAGDLAVAQRYGAQLTGHLLELSLDPFGCHVVQKLLDLCDASMKARVIDELASSPNTLMQKSSAHVWNRLLAQPNPPALYRRVAEIGTGLWASIVQDDGGTLIVQHLLEDWDEVHTSVVAKEILQDLALVAVSACGSLVLVPFVDRNVLPFHGRVMELASVLATHSLGAKLVDRLLTSTQIDGSLLSNFVDEITRHESDQDPLVLTIAAHISGASLLSHMLLGSWAPYADKAKLVRKIFAYRTRLLAEGGTHAAKVVGLIGQR